jgi:biotin transport system substrate-specific component
LTHAAAVASPRVLADLVPRVRARDLGLIAAAALLTAASAQLAIYIPGDPVPITGQTFAVLLSGAALGATRGSAGMVLYVGLGMLGLPVYADGEGGVSTAFGATGGYLLAFPIAAWVVGRLAEQRMDRSPWTALPAFTLGSLIVFAIGVPWLAVAADLSLVRAIELGFIPFIPGGIVKAVAAAALLPAAWRLVGRNRP